MKASCAGAALTILLVCSAWPQPRPTLVVSFDHGIDGVGPKGPVAGTAEGKPAFAPAKFGQALKSGPGTGYVQYPTAGIINPTSGTVEMWVCPLDWKPADEEFHVFFDARGQGALYLYKYYQGVRLLMLGCDNVAGPYFVSSYDLDWKPGVWHHIAGTWSPEGVMAYVDGKPAAKTPAAASLPTALGDTFRIGDHPWHLPRTSSSLVDQVRLYDHALSPAHIAAHFQGKYDFTVPLSAETLGARADVDLARSELRVSVTTGGADVDETKLGGQVACVRKGAPFPGVAATLAFRYGQASAALRLPAAAGEYEIVARASVDGRQVAERRGPFTVPTTEWKGNALGLEDRVLPPWTPLRVKGTVVSCWGRDYDFTVNPLPGRISSAGAELLADLPRLVVRSGAATARWRHADWAVPEEGPDTRRVVIGQMQGDLGEASLTADVRTTVEYDGVMVCEVSLSKPETLLPDALALELPMKAEHALYRHTGAQAWESASGSLPAGEGVVDKSPFIPFYWLGDNDRGLFWFCESDEMWPNGESGNAIEVERRGGQVILRLNLLARGQKLPPRWKFTFGLQATPVKPLPSDWRKWRLTPGRKANVDIIWPTPEKNSLRYFGYPEASDPEVFARRVADLHKQGIRAVPYLCLSYLSAACPEWPFYHNAWAMGPVDTGSGDVAAYGAGFAMVSPCGKDYSDFILGKNAAFVQRYGIDGLYHDNTWPYSSDRLEAGCGYLRDGKVHPTYPLLAYRALYRRMYAVMKALPRETFTMAHMSSKVTAPILAYDDSYLDGEHFRGRVKDSYLDVLTLDTFRAEFMGRQWGIIPFFLPEFDAERAAQVEPTRGLMGLLMIHDTSVWPIWCNTDVANQALAALDEFGIVDAQFIPYFDPVPPVTTELKDVWASAYKRGDGRALVVIANVGREDRSGEVRLNAQRLGLPVSKVISWPDKQALSVQNGALQVSVPRLGYRMVVVE